MAEPQVAERELGDLAFDSSNNYVNQVMFDASILDLDTSISNTSAYAHDVSSNKLDDVDNISGSGSSIYSYTLENVAYMKKIIQGTGATITEDVSTITIAVAGAAGYVSKYATAFSPGSDVSSAILVGDHGLGTGPFNISVYENNEGQIYPGIRYISSGDIYIEWTNGAITGDCSVLITG